MSEAQLERSVLESKERDELLAIADALGTRPTSRAKKADLVTAILRATGVEDPGPAPAPARRPRVRKAAAPDDAGGGAPGPTGTGSTDSSTGTTATPTGSTASSGEPAASVPSPGSATADTPDDADAPAVPSTEGESGSSVAVDPQGAAAGDEPAASQDADLGGDADDAMAGGEGVAGGVTEDASGSAALPLDFDTTGADLSSAAPPPGASPGSPVPAGRPPVRPASTGPVPAGTGSAGLPTQSNGAGSHNGSAAAAPTAPAAPAGGERPEGEGSGRRNRRRRGRDRGADRIERELQGAGAEVPYSGEPIPVSGLLDLREDGYGFVRTDGYLAGPEDVYVSISQVRRFALRRGDHIQGTARPAGPSEKYPALLRVDAVCGLGPDEARSRVRFEDLTPVHPDRRLDLDPREGPVGVPARLVDLLAPIGRGQRALVSSPPGGGATSVLTSVAAALETGSPDAHLMVVLVDERPEDVTEVRRMLHAEVVASASDRPAEEHLQVAELALERAKRMVEQGRDVVLVLDGITRLARSYNLANPGSGRIVSGGIDPAAVQAAKAFFGAARNTEEAGSLTILAAVLIGSGSGVDEVVFEEIEGTATMQVRLDRSLADRRLYPAIDVARTSTRREELLYDPTELDQVRALRRSSTDLAEGEGGSAASLERLLARLDATRTRSELLAELATSPAPSA